MSGITRRSLVGLGAVAVGVAATKAADGLGLLAPDSAGVYGPGEALTYAAHRLLASNSSAREFAPEDISKPPFANEVGKLPDSFRQMQTAGFANWHLRVDGMVAKPLSLVLDEIKAMPVTSHITSLACEEGWNYIAEWKGARLSHVLELAGVSPKARFVVYRSLQDGWWDSMDIDEAMHPQTLVAYGMNGGELAVPLGGPLRMRVPRQLGYKSVKYLAGVTVTDDIRKFGKGLGSAAPEGGYAWYAGI